ncbi:MAG TPA: STAS domain-containing protein [Tepidisphaeraceae bacterium]|jgi:anti-anti-sigma factor
MKLHQQRHGAVTLLKPDGPLIEGAAAEFDQAARAIMTATLGRLVIDMSTVPFVDSVGLETLLDLTEVMEDSGRVLKLCGVNKTVRQVLEITEIDSLFDHFEDANSAVRSFL